MKKAALLLTLFCSTAQAQVFPEVTVSFGVPYAVGPSETEDGWYVPIVIYNPNQREFRGFQGNNAQNLPNRNIHFGGNIKAKDYCFDPPWLPGNVIICESSTIPGPGGFCLDGDYWSEPAQYDPSNPHTSGGIGEESWDDPDSAFKQLAFIHNSTIGEVCPEPFPVSGVALTIRVVKRYATAQNGTITLAPTTPAGGPFSSHWIDCDGAAQPVAVGPPLTLPPPAQCQYDCGGGGNHEDPLMAEIEGSPKAARAATKRTTWAKIKSYYR